jgi:Tfp pilus assembly protein PilZ
MKPIHMRLASRIAVSLRVDWQVEGEAAHVVSHVANMSTGGVYVCTSLPARVGARLELALLTDRGMVPACGRVVRSDPEGMAVRFESWGASLSDGESDVS